MAPDAETNVAAPAADKQQNARNMFAQPDRFRPTALENDKAFTLAALAGLPGHPAKQPTECRNQPA